MRGIVGSNNKDLIYLSLWELDAEKSNALFVVHKKEKYIK